MSAGFLENLPDLSFSRYFSLPGWRHFWLSSEYEQNWSLEVKNNQNLNSKLVSQWVLFLGGGRG